MSDDHDHQDHDLLEPDPMLLDQHVEPHGPDHPSALPALTRAYRHHIQSAHRGDDSACRCELVDADRGTIVTSVGVENVDGEATGVTTTRDATSGAAWRAPRRDTDVGERDR